MPRLAPHPGLLAVALVALLSACAPSPYDRTTRDVPQIGAGMTAGRVAGR